MSEWTLKDVKHALAVYRLGGSDAIDRAIQMIQDQADMIECLEAKLEEAEEHRYDDSV
jgi:hypothetical protein